MQHQWSTIIYSIVVYFAPRIQTEKYGQGGEGGAGDDEAGLKRD